MLKRINVKNLRLGMFISELCGLPSDHPFEKSNFLLNSPSDLASIKKSNTKDAWIDTSKGYDEASGAREDAYNEKSITPAGKPISAEGIKPKIEHVSMDEEIKIAAIVCGKAKEAVMSMFSDARMGKAVEVEQAKNLVEEISDSIMRQPHALISLARLKNADEYTYMHSVAVCALMIALSRQLKLSNEEVREAGLAGLLHDIGKIGIPSQLLNKPGKLTDEEYNIIKNHPEIGSNVLLGNPMISVLVLDVVMHHHEKMDGTGYPHRLPAQNISMFAKMGAVCDIYDAVTSDRPYRKGWLPAEAIRKMAEWCKGHLDEHIFQAFVKTVGIYPIGSLVRLESGRLGVVTEQTAGTMLCPKVKVFFSAKLKAPILQEIIDLSQLIGKEKIIGRESAEDWGFKNLDALWSRL